MKYNAYAVFDMDSFEIARKGALGVIGEKGRVATLPEIIYARSKVPAKDRVQHPLFRQYFVTDSIEYVGLSKEGEPVAVVIHGGGPEPELVRGDRDQLLIPLTTFHDMLDGVYGTVQVSPLRNLWSQFEYPLINQATKISDIQKCDLFKARLGGPKALDWLKNLEESPTEPVLLMGGPMNSYSYGNEEMFNFYQKKYPTYASAKRLCVSQYMTHMLFGGRREGNVLCEIDTFDRGSAARVLVVQGHQEIRLAPPMPSLHKLLSSAYRDECFTPSKAAKMPEMVNLIQIGEEFYTDKPKKGASMNCGVPEYLVTERTPLGTKNFKTKIGGYYGFVKYDTKEVQDIAPDGANAYVLNEMSIEGDYHVGTVTFYEVKVNTRRKLREALSIDTDVDLIRKHYFPVAAPPTILNPS